MELDKGYGWELDPEAGNDRCPYKGKISGYACDKPLDHEGPHRVFPGVERNNPNIYEDDK